MIYDASLDELLQKVWDGQRINQAEALRFLDTYVSEAPRGVYAAEAYGRRLSLTERLRGRAAAQPLGREYLERFPQGAYAQRARALVEARVQAP